MDNLVYEFIEYLKRKSYKRNTTEDYERTLLVFLKYIKDDYPDAENITDITREMMLGYEKYLSVKTDAKGKVTSLNRRKRYLLSVRAFFRYLEREEKIYGNPSANMAFPRERKSIIRDVLTEEEMERVLKACSGNSAKIVRDRAIMEFLYSTGIRSDELIHIRVRDIDLRERTVFIRKGKLGSERLLPFGEAALYHVKKYLEKVRPFITGEGSDELFVSFRGRMLSGDALRDLIKNWARAAGIEKNVTTHTFRHTCATHMLKGKADIRYVQAQLGHRCISTTERYLKIEISDLKEVHERCHPRERDDW